MTLAEKYPEAIAEFEKSGAKNFAAMARHFEKAHHMDQALGFANAVSAWIRGRGKPSLQAERAAELWMKLNTAARPELTTSITPEPEAPAAPRPPAGTLILLACQSPEVAAKIQRLAVLLGCDAVEI